MLAKLGENWLGQSAKQEIITKDVTYQPIQIIIKVNEKPSQIHASLAIGI